MPKRTILAIDDEPHILDLLAYNLEKAGYTLLRAENGEAGLAILHSTEVDLLLLDWVLPEMDGMEVLQTIRATPNLATLPIIMLTAKKSEIDIVLALEMGADDFISKPFGTHELGARVKALLRRAKMVQMAQAPEESIKVGTLVLNKAYREVWKEGEALSLSMKEFELLYLLASHRNRVFTREQLIERAWGYDYEGDPRTIDVHIRNLRKKVERDPNAPEYLLTSQYQTESNPYCGAGIPRYDFNRGLFALAPHLIPEWNDDRSADLSLHRHLCHLCDGACPGGHSAALELFWSVGAFGSDPTGRSGIRHLHQPICDGLQSPHWTISADGDGLCTESQRHRWCGASGASCHLWHRHLGGVWSPTIGHTIYSHIRAGQGDVVCYIPLHLRLL